MNLEGFIELNRTFYQLKNTPKENSEGDSFDIEKLSRQQIGIETFWDKLCEEPRVVILAEAGAGKTSEIRNIAKKLRAEGKFAFFLRLEHISTGVDTAFEEGTLQEFRSWLESDMKGWILLDSVDEARLKDVKDFERAVRKISVKISTAISRSHIVLTSRITAWRPVSDLAICNSFFPCISKNEVRGDSQLSVHTINPELEKEKGFKVWSMADLSKEQVTRFLEIKGIKGTSVFIDEMEKRDAWAFATRPQDLEEIISFWSEEKRIGTWLELMRHSVDRRLKERDQDRADSKPISQEIARKGAQTLAAACTFTNNSAIRVPEGNMSTKGLDVKSVLYDWNDVDCQVLLSRPVFDEAIYGYVRFHHRSVREYLTAEWLFEKLKDNGSRQRIESLFFREQYGRIVIVASLRPVLSWLALFDSRILERVYELQPGIILEGGDPGSLPTIIRRQILHRICSELSAKTSNNEFENASAVQRFAAPDLAEDIRSLLSEYCDENNVLSYLLNLVWRGRIVQLLDEVIVIASDSNMSSYVRVDAIRTIKSIGSKEGIDTIKKMLLEEKVKRSRAVVGEILSCLEPNEETLDWLFAALQNLMPKDESLYDTLDVLLHRFLEQVGDQECFKFIQLAARNLRAAPFIEKKNCELSAEFIWVFPFCVQAVEKLVATKSLGALTEESLFILSMLPRVNDVVRLDRVPSKYDLSKMIIEWQELNYQLFWNIVKLKRESLNKESKQLLSDILEVYGDKSLWDFDSINFELLLEDVRHRSVLEDRLIALSYAFYQYKRKHRPQKWLKMLKQSASGHSDLQNKLGLLLRPPAQPSEVRANKRKAERWRKQDNEEALRKKNQHESDIKWLKENFHLLRDGGVPKDEISNTQYYMHVKMQELSESDHKFTTGNWKGLIKEYGQEVATAFRDGIIEFWRNYTPCLRSERDYGNQREYKVLFGLSSLCIESNEDHSWPESLNEREVEIACRYAFYELNGFPDWFPKLTSRFPEVVSRLILNEIKWELNTATKIDSDHYLLDKLVYGPECLWDKIASGIMKLLKLEPACKRCLSLALKIVHKSSVVSDEELSELAMSKCNFNTAIGFLPYWFAVWIGANPAPAIKALSDYLLQLEIVNENESKLIAMETIVCLVGERRSRAISRENYIRPKYLKELYRLMHKYIKVDEDIHREGKGVYSPELRDNAQDARELLFSMLKEIPGKDTYLAMIELSELLPNENRRKWMKQHAKERAEVDADFTAWKIDGFVEFHKFLECTPQNNFELFRLAVQRLMDLKHDIEEGDESIASLLIKETEERGLRKFFANWCRERSSGRYVIAQEEELADSRRPDWRFHSSAFDGPVPIELKIANKWTGPALLERLENQLCGDYLRDNRSGLGVYLLVYRGGKQTWELPNKKNVNFDELIINLQEHWECISGNFPQIEQIKVIGIDLTKRALSKVTLH